MRSYKNDIHAKGHVFSDNNIQTVILTWQLLSCFTVWSQFDHSNPLCVAQRGYNHNDDDVRYHRGLLIARLDATFMWSQIRIVFKADILFAYLWGEHITATMLQYTTRNLTF